MTLRWPLQWATPSCAGELDSQTGPKETGHTGGPVQLPPGLSAGFSPAGGGLKHVGQTDLLPHLTRHRGELARLPQLPTAAPRKKDRMRVVSACSHQAVQLNSGRIILSNTSFTITFTKRFFICPYYEQNLKIIN